MPISKTLYKNGENLKFYSVIEHVWTVYLPLGNKNNYLFISVPVLFSCARLMCPVAKLIQIHISQDQNIWPNLWPCEERGNCWAITVFLKQSLSTWLNVGTWNGSISANYCRGELYRWSHFKSNLVFYT